MDHRPDKDNSVGPLVGIIIIVLILVLGGLYFWGERLNRQREALRAATPATRTTNAALLKADTSASTTPEYR
ncbi:hypothetical protein K8Q93_00845 [Candidatus Parcubacteria bacterium]|nr:hypothetical protein [Candidatus Parcubacteria bacterium]